MLGYSDVASFDKTTTSNLSTTKPVIYGHWKLENWQLKTGNRFNREDR